MKQSNTEFNLSGEFNLLRIIFYSLAVVPVMHILIVSSGVLTAPSMPSELAEGDFFRIMIGVALLLSVVAPNIRKLVLGKNNGERNQQPQALLTRYKAAVIVSLVLWDAVATIGLIGAALLGDVTACYSLSLLALAGMFFARPKEQEFLQLAKDRCLQPVEF